MGYIDVSYQAVTFLLSVVLGAVMCLLYDVLRALHKRMLKGFFEVFVSDILFWSIAAVITFCFLVIRCNGYVRGFVIVGQVIGFSAIRLTLSRYFLAGIDWIMSVFSGIFRFVWRFVAKIFRILKNILKKILKYAKKYLQPKCKLLYNHLKVQKFKSTDKVLDKN